jgi:hypothetical protein
MSESKTLLKNCSKALLCELVLHSADIDKQH